MPEDVEEQESTLVKDDAPPHGLGALKLAVDFVARGHAIPKDMVLSLERMLTNQQERIDLLSTVFTHVQVERLRNILEGMASVESRVFHPAMVMNYTGRELLELLKLSQAEVRAIVTYLEAKGSKGTKTSPEGISNVADPAKAHELKQAEEAVGKVQPGGRHKLRELLQQVLKEGEDVIEVSSHEDGQ